jgi:hypothetical protein
MGWIFLFIYLVLKRNALASLEGLSFHKLSQGILDGVGSAREGSVLDPIIDPEEYFSIHSDACVYLGQGIEPSKSMESSKGHVFILF